MWCLKVDISLRYLKLYENFSTSRNRIYLKIYEKFIFIAEKFKNFTSYRSKSKANFLLKLGSTCPSKMTLS